MTVEEVVTRNRSKSSQAVIAALIVVYEGGFSLKFLPAA